jgi:lipoprotein-anchoring transpeptidase ErfK/SrfK
LRSRAVSEIDLYNERRIVVDVSDQIMHLKIGEDLMATFPVSTGAYRTPTPYGTTRIKFKQEVRVGSSWPHYVMPKFMWFRDGGYGIHALPSLRNDGGTYWREARNHIQTRVSHGCVRLLPEDAEVAYAFAEAGTLVTVQP